MRNCTACDNHKAPNELTASLHSALSQRIARNPRSRPLGQQIAGERPSCFSVAGLRVPRAPRMAAWSLPASCRRAVKEYAVVWCGSCGVVVDTLTRPPPPAPARCLQMGSQQPTIVGPEALACACGACHIDAQRDVVRLGMRIMGALEAFFVYGVDWSVSRVCPIDDLSPGALAGANAKELEECRRRGGMAWTRTHLVGMNGNVGLWRSHSGLDVAMREKVTASNTCNMMTDLFVLALSRHTDWRLRSRALGLCAVTDAWIVAGEFVGPYTNPLLLGVGNPTSMFGMSFGGGGGMDHLWLELRVTDARGCTRIVGLDFTSAQLDMPALVVWHDSKPRPAGYVEHTRETVYGAHAPSRKAVEAGVLARLQKSMETIPDSIIPSPGDILQCFNGY